MKKLLFVLVLFTCSQNIQAQCTNYPCYVSCGSTLTLHMWDSGGNGWNGYYFALFGGCSGAVQYVNTTPLAYTLSNGSYNSVNFWVPCGSWAIQVVGGSYGSEISWSLYGTYTGNYLGSGGGNYYSPGYTLTIGGGCPTGCIDQSANNYNSNAYIQMSASACTYNPPPPVNGCTDPNANNYNPNATVDDGSCVGIAD